MAAIYEEYRDEDGFLYITYSGENVCAFLLLFPSNPPSTDPTSVLQTFGEFPEF